MNKVRCLALASACCILGMLAQEAQGADDERDYRREGRPVMMVQGLPTGGVMPFAGREPPPGWLFCHGQAISRQEYNDLYQVIDRLYTPEHIDQNHFCIPDFRGRVPVGADGGAKRVTSSNTIGASGGEEKHQLTVDEMASHSFRCSVYPGATFGGQIPGYQLLYRSFGNRIDAQETVFSAGNDQPHNIMQPYMCLNYIINTGRMDQLEVEVQLQRHLAGRLFG